eukprot:s169_g7.t1
MKSLFDHHFSVPNVAEEVQPSSPRVWKGGHRLEVTFDPGRPGGSCLRIFIHAMAAAQLPGERRRAANGKNNATLRLLVVQGRRSCLNPPPLRPMRGPPTCENTRQNCDRQCARATSPAGGCENIPEQKTRKKGKQQCT